jgi:hypothetical protein
VGFKGSLDVLEKKKYFTPCQDFHHNSSDIQPVDYSSPPSPSKKKQFNGGILSSLPIHLSTYDSVRVA